MKICISHLIKLSLILVFSVFFGCGPNAEEIAKEQQKEKLKIAKAHADSIAESIKNNPARFEKYLQKMQGTWTFEDTQPCTENLKNRYGFTKENGGTGICVKMKIIIEKNYYKAFLEDFAVKNGKLIKKSIYNNEPDIELPLDYNIATENPFCQGRLELRQCDIEKQNNPTLANILCFNGGSSVCTEFGGNNIGQFNQLYWDDSKEAIHWFFAKGGSNTICDFNGYCKKIK